MNLSRDEVVWTIREAARRLNAGTATYFGFETKVSCQAVWGVARDLVGEKPSQGQNSMLTDAYGKLFAPEAALLDDTETRHFRAYWLDSKYTGMHEKEIAEFRLTALCLYAAMIEAGDVEGL